MKLRGYLRAPFVVVVCTTLLQACGGGSDGTAAEQQNGSGSGNPPAVPAPAPAPAPTPANRAPTISGSPALQVQANQAYTFAPRAADADGDALTFSIANKPAWATFSATTGQLSGTPTAANVGDSAGVIITVSDGKASASLAAFSVNVAATAAAPPVVNGNAALAWTPPATRTDGTVLNNLAGYKIRYGTNAGEYSVTITVPNAGVAEYVVENLNAGTYFFAVSAYDTAGVESGLSPEVSKKIG